MNPRIASIAERIRSLEDELEAEIAARRDELRFTIHERRVRFEREVQRRHRDLKTRLSRYVLGARPLFVLTAPVIYSVGVPLLPLDLFATVYQAIWFRVYGIPRVDRRRYIAFDRRHLAHLNAIEKLNCEYCSYANGLIVRAGDRRAHRAVLVPPIKHAIRVRSTHERYRQFVDYGDATAYRERLEDLRRALQEVGALRERPES